MSTFMFKYLNHDLRLLKFNKPLHFFAEMPHIYIGMYIPPILMTVIACRNVYKFVDTLQ